MLYAMEQGKLQEVGLVQAEAKEDVFYLGFFPQAEANGALEAFGYGGHSLAEGDKAGPMLLENREGYDFLRVHLPNPALIYDKALVYLRKSRLFFVCEEEVVLERIRRLLVEGENARLYADRLLYTFFEKTAVFDVSFFEGFEQEISDLESALIGEQKQNFVMEINSLRKRLMPLKRHYEQLLNLLDELQENENGILNDASLRYFRIFSNKVDRHYHSILNLRDYVTQVREAYQSEVDIDLNNIMKIFTVITAIFLPLSLIVGWYGMNLKMPEFAWPYAYPMVIALSMAVVGFCIAYFKRNKWF